MRKFWDSELRDEVIDRLLHLDGKGVWVTIARGTYPDVESVVRRGVLHLKRSADQTRDAYRLQNHIPIAHVVDERDVPLALLRSDAYIHLWNSVVRFERRLSFWIDVDDQELSHRPADHDVLTPIAFARSLVAELEAGLGYDIVLGPDPDPQASHRFEFLGTAAEDPEPFSIWTSLDIGSRMRHASVSWRPESFHASYWAPAQGAAGNLIFRTYGPAPDAGSNYSEGSLRRLGADLRAFFDGHDEHLLQR